MKDAYYFSHDSNAKDDPKCVLLIEQLGLEGYGIYWVLVETLRDQPEYKYPISLLPAIARRYNSTSEKVKTVVFNYGLFEIQGDEFFYSESLLIRMQKLEDKRVKASLAGKISAQKRLTNSTDVQQPFNVCSTTVQPVKESKVKKSKEKEIKEDNSKIPSYDEFQTYALDKEPLINTKALKYKYDSWIENNWYNGKGKKIENWKTALLNTLQYIDKVQAIAEPVKTTKYLLTWPSGTTRLCLTKKEADSWYKPIKGDDNPTCTEIYD